MLERFFKRQIKTVNSNAVVNRQPSIEAQIHNDVYSAQELLIKEAEAILSQPLKYNEERYDTLKKLSALGFRNADQVKEFNKIVEERSKHTEISKLIADYQQKYPLNKFIDQDTVKAVCEKYNLYLTVVDDYISDIPENKQKEIVNFRFFYDDFRTPTETGFDRFWFSGRRLSFDLFDPFHEKDTSKKESKIQGQNLLIMAPEHKIDMRDKIKVGHILTKDDPIVLQPVKGGYLIVSSWGLEASDELIVNNKFN